nr:ferrochelatase [Paramagnetospirillum kuznetsovii]
MSKTKTAIVLFNLGGPDCPEAVEPFLFNLFNDKAIIGAPGPIRWLLAKYISKKRAPVAREIYAHLGGRSPLLPQTEAQAKALELALGEGYRCFIAMRYWHPLTDETVTAVKAWAPDEIILLPLYPQFSGTTVGSSMGEWHREARRQGLNVPTRGICCYPDHRDLIAGFADLVGKGFAEASVTGRPRVLFSAHGLPKTVIEAGDPYQAQVEITAKAVVEGLNLPGLDWVVCYQSRVGPMEWIGPSTESELQRAGRDKVPVVVVPIAFVSEHSETLVELDIEYRHRAVEWGVPAYVRVAALGCHPRFIAALAELIVHPVAIGAGFCKRAGRTCPGVGLAC